jgi:hypothetical protein
MGLFARKDPVVGKTDPDRAKAHTYKPPALPPSSGHVSCQVCGLAPEDVVHGAAKSDSDMHW